MDHLPHKIIFKATHGKDDPEALVDFIAAAPKVQGKLSKALIKEAMSQGSCWVKKGNSKLLKRVRRAKTKLRATDSVEFYFDRELFLKQREQLDTKPELISEHKDWSVWNKPAGWLAQGTKYGDSLSLLRFAEKWKGKEVFLVHRLDKETMGLMLIAHNSNANQGLGKLWATQKVGKKYWAEVLGVIKEDEGTGKIDSPIEGKESLTFYKVLERRAKTTLVEVEIKTGRKHQIRKHFLELGHPVMGDPRYGQGNKNRDGMKLMACALRFRWGGEPVEIALEECPF